ncbi:MAG: hypothetical protein ACRC1M_04675 [Methanobacteriaceae archaeon]
MFFIFNLIGITINLKYYRHVDNAGSINPLYLLDFLGFERQSEDLNLIPSPYSDLYSFICVPAGIEQNVELPVAPHIELEEEIEDIGPLTATVDEVFIRHPPNPFNSVYLLPTQETGT